MPDAEEQLRRRLHAELDRVQPPHTTPRYLAAPRRPVILRLAPAVLVATVAGILGLSVYAGSPNPVVWTEHVVDLARPSPSPEIQPTPAPRTPTSRPSQKPEQHDSPEPSEKPEPTQSPEQHESPEPSDGHSGDGTSGDGGSSGGGGSSGDGGTSDSGDGERS
jgi:uncharacterized membrane protein YgcG